MTYTAQEIFEHFYETFDDRSDEKERVQAVLEALCDGEALESFFKDPRPEEDGDALLMSAWKKREASNRAIVEDACEIAKERIKNITL